MFASTLRRLRRYGLAALLSFAPAGSILVGAEYDPELRRAGQN